MADIVIFYELPERELNNANLLKAEFEKRGYSVRRLKRPAPAGQAGGFPRHSGGRALWRILAYTPDHQPRLRGPRTHGGSGHNRTRGPGLAESVCL